MMADALGMAASGYILFGDLTRAHEHAREGLEISRRIGNLWGMSVNGYTLGYVLLEFGETSEAIRMLEASTEWAARANFIGTQATVPVVLSWVFKELGLHHYHQQWREEMFKRSRAEEGMPEVWRLWRLIQLYSEGDSVGALALAGQIDVPPIIGAGQEAVFTGLVLARISAQEAHYDDALSTIDKLLTMMAELNIRAMRADILTIRGSALAGLGRQEEALSAWREAYEEALRQGARRAEWPALVALSAAEPEPVAAAEYRRQAVEVIRYLEGNIDEPELREAFLNLPDVRRALSEE
jgi:tetratricopeptide (TPR) repeat protein